MPTIYQTYNINSTTSMLLLNTTNLPNDNDIVVLLSNTNLPGRLVSVRDTTGNLSTTKRVIVSTVAGVSYLDGASSTTLNQPFSFISVANRDPSTWVLENTFAFPANESAASVESVSAKYIIASTIQAQNIFSTTSMTISSLNVENVVTTNDLAGRGNFYLNTSTITFEGRGNVAIRNGIWAGSSISTSADLFVGRDISTLSSFSAGGNAFFGGFISTLGSLAASGNLTAAGNTLVSSFSTIGRIGLGSDVLMTAWNLRASTTQANIVVGSNSVSTTTLFANNAIMSNVSTYGPAIGFGSDVLMTQSQLRAASTLATNVVASNVLRAESSLTSTLTVYTQANFSSLSTVGASGFGGDVYIVGSRLFTSEINASSMTLSNTLAAVSIVTSTLVVFNFEATSNFSTTGGNVGFGNNVVMGGYTFTAGHIQTSTLVASNSLNTSTLNASSTFGLSFVVASTTMLSGRTISTIRYEGGQIAISSITGDGSQLVNLPAVSSLSLQSTVVGLGLIYVSSAAAGVNQTQLVSTNVGLGTLGYISSAAAISGSFITPGNMETGLSTQQLYVSDITLSNAITATYPSGTPPNPVALFDATGGGAVYMKMRSGATNELFYGVDGTGNAVIYSQWPGLQLQPLNLYGSLVTANTTEFQVTASGPNVAPFTQIKNVFVSTSELYASTAMIGKVIADGSLLSNLPLSTVATFTSNTARGVSSLHGVVSSGLSTVALFTSNTSNFFLGSVGINVSSGFSTLAGFTSNTALGVSSLHGVVSSGLSTVALFTSNTSNFFLPVIGINISSGLSTVAGFTSNTALGVSSLHGVVSSGLSTVALFTSNTSNYAKGTLQDFSTGLSTVALFTSNTSNYARGFLQDFSTPLSTVALFTSNTSNYAVNTSNYARSLLQDFSTGLSSVALFTSNTSNYAKNILQDFSTGLSTVALFTSNTSNYAKNILQDFSTGLSTVALSGGSGVSTFSTAIGTQFLTSNLVASTIQRVVIQPSLSNVWVAVGEGTNMVKYSVDGITWSNATHNYTGSVVRAVAYSGSMFVAVGDGNSSTSIQYSYNGINWSNCTGGFSGIGTGVNWNGRMWVATGVGYPQAETIKYSFNGINWSNSVSGGFNFNNNGASGFLGVEWNGNIWLVCGAYPYGDGPPILYSKDGSNWIGSMAGGYVGMVSPWLGEFFIVSLGGDLGPYVYYTADGVNYTVDSNLPITTNYIYRVASDGSKYVGGGADSFSTIKYSLNAKTWTNTSFSMQSVSDIRWNGRQYVAAGLTSSANNLAYSSDGFTWTAVSGFSTRAWSVAYSSNTTYRIQQQNFGTEPEATAQYLTSTNQMLFYPSSMVMNDSLKVDKFWHRVGINTIAPQYSLDVNGTSFLSTVQTSLLSTKGTVVSSLGIGIDAPQYPFETNGIVKTSAYFLADSTDDMIAYGIKQLIVPGGQNFGYGLSTGIYFTKAANNQYTGLSFLTTSNLTTVSSLTMAADSGFVGINCNAPLYDLDVNGKMRSRIVISNVTGTSLTSGTSPAITSNSFGVYYNITNSGFNALTVPTLATTDDGSFWLLRNNTASALSVTITGAVSGIPPSPLSISASNSAIVSWNGTAFVMF